jgi:flagellar biosynthesis protein FlhF
MMKLKKFTAASVREALLMIKNELGPDAVIIRTEKLKTGVLGGEDVFEVTAALDEQAEIKRSETPKEQPTNYHTYTAKAKVKSENPKPDLISETKLIHENPSTVVSEMSRLQEDFHMQMTALHREVAAIKSGLRVHSSSLLTDIPTEFKAFAERLISQGMEIHLLKDLIAELVLECPTDERSLDDLDRVAQEVISRKIPVKPLVALPGKSRVLLFVGPTGVGKSTTIAKLAAREVLLGAHSVGIISTDAYRMGALEQMNLFARAAEIDFEAVFEMSDLDVALEKFRDKNLILVDTAGRSKNHPQHMQELFEIKEQLLPDEVHLVVSASTRDRDLRDIHQRFSSLGLNRLVFTKIDETVEFSSLYNLPVEKGLALSFLCDGQNIPDDLHEANSKRLAGSYRERSFLKSQLEYFQELRAFSKNKLRSSTPSISIASGKGGVGKTSICVNLALELASKKKKILLLDGDPGMANLHIHLGYTPNVNWGDYLEGSLAIEDIVAKNIHGIDFIHGFSGLRQTEWIQSRAAMKLLSGIDQISKYYDLVLIDVGAGIGEIAMILTTYVNLVYLVLTSELTSVADAYGCLKTIQRLNPDQKLAILINRAVNQSDALKTYRAFVSVSQKFLGISPDFESYLTESVEVSKSIMNQKPLNLYSKDSFFAKEISDIAEKLKARFQI